MRMESFATSLIERQGLSGREEDDVSNLDNVESDGCPQASDGGCAENPLINFQLSNLFEEAFHN